MCRDFSGGRRVAALALALLLGRYAAEATATPSAAPQAASVARFLVRGATLLTLDPALGSGSLGIVQADLLFGDTIVAVGPGLAAAGAEVIDARGKIVMPGFVDLHNHLWQSLIRGCGAGYAVAKWIDHCVLPGLRLDESAAYAGVRLSTLDLVSTGITTVVDWSHSFTPAFAAGNLRALTDSHLRFVYAYFLYLPDQQAADLAAKKAAFIDGNPLASLHVAAHPAAAHAKQLAAAVAVARQHGLPFNVHFLESAGDLREDPLGLLTRSGAFAGRVVLNHAVHASGADLDRLRAHQVAVSYNPLSNMRLASGVMPAGEIAARRIPLGLGLDGGANDTSDMFASMRAAVGLQRAATGRPDQFPKIEDAIHMATLGGADALGMAERIGSLTPGKRADLLILDPQRVNFAPLREIAAQIVFNGQPANVEFVFVDGRPLKRDGKLVLSDTSEGAVIAAAEAAAPRLAPPLPPLLLPTLDSLRSSFALPP